VLKNCDIGVEDAELLAAALRQNCSIRHLDISENASKIKKIFKPAYEANRVCVRFAAFFSLYSAMFPDPPHPVD
jgi:hypothetical protein